MKTVNICFIWERCIVEALFLNSDFIRVIFDTQYAIRITIH